MGPAPTFAPSHTLVPAMAALTHTSGLWALSFARGVREAWPSGCLGLSGLHSQHQGQRPQWGHCQGPRAWARLQDPGAVSAGATARRCARACCVCCVCTCAVSAEPGPAVPEPHLPLSPGPKDTVILEGAHWQGHQPHSLGRLGHQDHDQARAPQAAWGRGHTPHPPPQPSGEAGCRLPSPSSV